MESPTSFVTGVVRGSFLDIFKPREDGHGKMKYGMVVLIPKTDTTTVGMLKAARRAAIEAEWGTGELKFKVANTVHDGDGVKENGSEYGPECKGHWVLRASSIYPPGIVDQKVQKIIDENAIRSGDYFIVELNAFPYTNETRGRGISFGLRNVQFVREGEPLGGARRPQDVFKPVAGAADDLGDMGSAKPSFDDDWPL